MQLTNTRNSRLDTIKCILIFFVIFGHCLSNLATRDIWHGDIYGVIYKFIYTFHMPLFTIISGYLFTIKDEKRILRSSLKLFCTYILFDVAYMFYFGDFDFLSIFYNPRWILWYLYCIPIWKIMTFFASKVTSEKVLLPLSIFLCLLANIISFRTTQFVFSFYPFFLFGFMFKKNKPEVVGKSTIVLPVLILALVFVLTKLNIVDVVSSVYTEYAYSKDAFISEALQKAISTAVMLMSSSSVFLLIKSGGGILSDIGKNTLAIYLLHGFMIKFAGISMNRILGHYDLFWCFVYSLMMLLAAYWLSRTKIVKTLLDPFGYVTSKIKHNE